MDPNLLGVGAALLKAYMSSGNNESTRALIQEELRKSQTQENTDMLKQMLSVLEQKHAADLQEVNSEKERYKLEVEFLRKELQEAKRDKKAEEKAIKMKEILTHLAELSLQKGETFAKNQKEKVNSPQSCNFQGNYTGGTLPWMDSSKGKFQSTPHEGGHHSRRTNNHNFASNQNFQHPQKSHNSNFQQQHFPPKQNMQGYNHFQQQQQQFLPHQQQQQQFLPHQQMQQNTHFKHNKNMLHNLNNHQKRNFHSYQNVDHNPNFPPQNNFQPNMTQNTDFQQKTNFQQSRGQSSNRYRGRGQGGNRRGRSTSIGRDHSQRSDMNQESNDEQPSTSFHVQVTKMGKNWVSSENISYSSDASSQRGRGNYRGHGRGRGRGNVHQGMDGAQSVVKKNRRKNRDTEPDGTPKQYVPRNKEKNNEGDPEENCAVS